MSESLTCKYVFSRSGTNQWRDQLKPAQILQHLARLKGVSPPTSEDNGNTLSFNGQQYQLSDFGDCLFYFIFYIFPNWHAKSSVPLIYFN